jgi:putative hemolysin
MSDKLHFESGSLRAFIAETEEDVIASQQLRYRVFVEEMGANASPQMHAEKRDFDEFDDICDHLLVKDVEKNTVVGSYRLLRRSQVPAGRKFYTESEYDISKMLGHFKGEVMELGRSCVDKDYRSRSSMQLLWRALGEYSDKHSVELMFGCASFPGSDHKAHAVELSCLYHYYLAPEEFRPRALENLYTNMDIIPKENYDAKRAMASMPPLVKGYLRLGAYIGDGAFEDKNYNTTDVCIVLKMDRVTGKYHDRYVGGNKS